MKGGCNMIANVVNYLKYREDKRTNQANEAIKSKDVNSNVQYRQKMAGISEANLELDKALKGAQTQNAYAQAQANVAGANKSNSEAQLAKAKTATEKENTKQQQYANEVSAAELPGKLETAENYAMNYYINQSKVAADTELSRAKALEATSKAQESKSKASTTWVSAITNAFKLFKK